MTDSTREDRSALPAFDKLWDYNDPAATEKAFRNILPAAREAGDRDYLAQLLTQIARTQGLQRRFEAAHATLDEADGLITDDMPVPRIRALLERGRVHNSSKQVAKARPLFSQAWELSRDEGEDFYAVDAAHMLGIMEARDDSLAWSEKAMKLAEQSADPKANGWLGSLYNNIGWTYHDMKRYEDALALFEKALVWHQGKDNEDRLQTAKWCVARGLRSLGRVEEALGKQQQLLAEMGENQDGYVYEELGECLLLLNRAAEAGKYFAKAHELLSKDQWLQANEPQRLKRLKELAGEAR